MPGFVTDLADRSGLVWWTSGEGVCCGGVDVARRSIVGSSAVAWVVVEWGAPFALVGMSIGKECHIVYGGVFEKLILDINLLAA